MEKNELIELTEKIATTYEQLNIAIDEIGKLKGVIEKITIATDDLQNTIKLVVNNTKLTEFKEQNQNATNKLKVDIEKIDKDLNAIMINRNQFVDFIETYKEMISRFQNMTEEETKVTNELIKKVSFLTGTINNNQAKLNTNIQKVNSVLDGQEIISNYTLLNKKIESISEKMTKIESLLQQKFKSDK
jgi:hypothetical protein